MRSRDEIGVPEGKDELESRKLRIKREEGTHVFSSTSVDVCTSV